MRQVILYPGEDGYWVVQCPSLPGCISQGKTEEEAIANIKEAIQLYLESLVEESLPIPPERFEAMVIAVPISDDLPDLRQVVLYTDEDGVWCAECPSLPGCFSDGPTQQEAITNIREAIALWIENAQAQGEPIPTEHFEALIVVVDEAATVTG
jgi:predicted RNase H-like HicB family nuclease